ncbi:TIGR04279 domain-containing protein [Geoglobus acetivorans]|uniref:TIGR04279 domain-containing protein n=1 Tax=Geoglobus acetivorans TaxID=565033 RepID=A0ABZ3H707_GEOAI
MRTRYILMLLLLPLLTLPASASVVPLVKVEIVNTSAPSYESLSILNPNNGNWIKMTGGDGVSIPAIDFVYSGINSTQYTRGSKIINITTNNISENQDYVVNYPFTTQPMYHPGDTVTAEILGENGLAGKTAYVYLIKTYPTQLKDALASAVDGDTQSLRNLLNNAKQNITVILNSTGDNSSISFGQLDPGDYAVVALLNASSEQNVTLISATVFQVLEHESTLSADTSITRSSVSDQKYLDGKFEIVGGSSNAKYTYVAVLMKKDTAFTLRLTSGGTKSTTNLTLKAGTASQEAMLVEGFKVAGVGLNSVNATTVEDWLNAFPSNAVTFSINRGATGTTYNLSILVQGLSDGDYYLYVAAWNASNSSQRVVAFNWTSVTITTVAPPPPPPSGGGGYIPLPPPAPTPTPTPVPEEGAYSTVVGVEKDKEVKIEIPPETAEKIDVVSLTIKAPESMNLKVEVRKLESPPAEVPEPPAKKVYRFVEITFRNNDTGEEVEPTGYIDFKVSKSWVAESGHDPEDIILMRYHNGWEELRTEMVGEDENYYYYRAETGGFSVFAIAVKEVAPSVTPTPTRTPEIVTPTPAVTPTAAKTETPGETPAPELTPTLEEQAAWWKNPLLWITIAVLIVLAVAYWRRS